MSELQSPTPLHLIDAGPDREAIAAFRIMASMAGAMLADKFGVKWPFYWCLLQVDTCGPEGLPKPLKGEIDLILGPIEARLAPGNEKQEPPQRENWSVAGCYPVPLNSENIQFVYDLSRLVALEVKCAYVDTGPMCDLHEPIVKSIKGGKLDTLRKQLQRDRACGFGSVGFVQIIAGPAISTRSVVEAIHSFGVATHFLPQSQQISTSLLDKLGTSNATIVVSPTLWGEDAYTGGILFDFKSREKALKPVSDAIRNTVQEFVRRRLELAVGHLSKNGGLVGLPVIIDASPAATFRNNQRQQGSISKSSGVDSRSITLAMEGVKIPPGATLFLCVPEGINLQNPSEISNNC